ncbi:MAG TPA: type IV toxin-antitoxin system AbiEi family antitoxin domain-containing protein [Acidimicrobiales bacterium]|nr:type IV toxin-antitoxin system AbiEi family antitoxin domain-containing protein [Acidimicrobiales bacterium]
MESEFSRHARRQHGLVTRAQAMAAGLSPSGVARRTRDGTWRRVAAGVYAVASSPATWRQRVLAACLALGAVASHRTAAALWGLSGFRPGPVHVLVAAPRSARSTLAIVHRTVELPRADVTTIDGIPVTRLARTLIDLAGTVPARALEEAVDDALCRRLVTLPRLDRRATALLGKGRAGSAAFADVLGSWRGDQPLPQEVAEARLLRRLVHAGLPPPIPQHEVYTPDGRFVGRLDLAWPDVRVGFELDGFRWHGSPRASQRDLARHNRLKALSWTVLQAMPADLAADGAHLAELARPLLASQRDPPMDERRPA